MKQYFKQAFVYGKSKKGQMGGMVSGVVGIALVAVIAIIMVSVYSGVFNDQVPRIKNASTCGMIGHDSNISCLNGSTRTVFENIPVFIGILVLLGAVGGFAIGRR